MRNGVIAHLRGTTTEPHVRAVNLCWAAKECPGDVTPQALQGFSCPHPAVQDSYAAEQTGGGVGRWQARGKRSRLTGRVILFGVSPQSCQFSSPGQKSFYLLNQMLGRTKCQANFKAGRCAEPQAPITLQQAAAQSAPLQICSLQTPGSPSPHALHFL